MQGWVKIGEFRGRRTSAVTSDTIDQLIVATLVETALALLAGPVMASMPRRADSVTHFPSLLAWPHGNDVTDDFVSRNSWACKIC